MSGIGGGGADDEQKGLLWKLPELKSKQLGKLGPAFGFGAGCGLGLGVGLLGGSLLLISKLFSFLPNPIPSLVKLISSYITQQIGLNFFSFILILLLFSFLPGCVYALILLISV